MIQRTMEPRWNLNPSKEKLNAVALEGGYALHHANRSSCMDKIELIRAFYNFIPITSRFVDEITSSSSVRTLQRSVIFHIDSYLRSYKI